MQGDVFSENIPRYLDDIAAKTYPVDSAVLGLSLPKEGIAPYVICYVLSIVLSFVLRLGRSDFCPHSSLIGPLYLILGRLLDQVREEELPRSAQSITGSTHRPVPTRLLKPGRFRSKKHKKYPVTKFDLHMVKSRSLSHQ
jgi:hypothetical protein